MYLLSMFFTFEEFLISTPSIFNQISQDILRTHHMHIDIKELFFRYIYFEIFEERKSTYSSGDFESDVDGGAIYERSACARI